MHEPPPAAPREQFVHRITEHLGQVGVRVHETVPLKDVDTRDRLLRQPARECLRPALVGKILGVHEHEIRGRGDKGHDCALALAGGTKDVVDLFAVRTFGIIGRSPDVLHHGRSVGVEVGQPTSKDVVNASFSDARGRLVEVDQHEVIAVALPRVGGHGRCLEHCAQPALGAQLFLQGALLDGDVADADRDPVRIRRHPQRRPGTESLHVDIVDVNSRAALHCLAVGGFVGRTDRIRERIPHHRAKQFGACTAGQRLAGGVHVYVPPAAIDGKDRISDAVQDVHRVDFGGRQGVALRSAERANGPCRCATARICVQVLSM